MTPAPSDSMKTLAKLIQSGDAAGIRELGKADAGLRAHLDEELPGGHFGATPLLFAVSKSNLAVIDALLDIGANIDARSHWWAGSFGVLDGDAKVAEEMITRGATVNINAAAHLGKIDRVKELLDSDPALVHHRGGDGRTPLHVAATVEIADLLIDSGANVNARDVDHESTPAQYAIGDRVEVARRLVDRGSETDIMLAAALGDTSLVAELIDADPHVVHVSVSDEWFPRTNPRAASVIYVWTLGANKTPQQLARERGHVKALQLLRERSPAEINLAEACIANDRPTMENIFADHPGLKSGLSKSIYPRFVGAAMDRQIESLRMMLEAGCPVNATSPGGATALHWAGFHGELRIARLLLDAHARHDVVDKVHHARPLGWAMYGSLHGWYRESGDYVGVVKAMLEAGAAPPTAFKDSDASPAVFDVLRNHRKIS